MRFSAPVVNLAARAASINVTGSALVTIPATQPPFAKLLDPSLSSFSLEFQYWPTYAGNATGQPNTYVNQLLTNLGERTGKSPALRVGGTSENTAYVDESFQVWNSSQISEVFGPFTSRSNTSIGKDWYTISGNLPAGTDFTFGINLYDDNQVALQGKMLSDAFYGSGANLTKDVSLKFVQVGNEPNFYFKTAAAYVPHWQALIETLMKNIKLGGKDGPTIWTGSEATNFGGFSLTGTLEAGILDNTAIKNATYILDEHQYSGALEIGAIPGGPPPGTLMEKSSIRGNLSTFYTGRLNAESYGKTYWMGEAGTYAAEAIFGLSNTAESAVWTVDYMLQAASMGIGRVYLHSTPNRLFAVFQPGWGFTNGTGIEHPHIMPMYNGLLVVNEMVGTSGTANVAEIQNENAGLASYGAWDNGKLARLVLINSNVFNETATTRSALNVTLGGGLQYKSASVKRLSIPYTTATEGITWAGQSFETTDGVPSGKATTESLEGDSVIVSASEVVMLTFA